MRTDNAVDEPHQPDLIEEFFGHLEAHREPAAVALLRRHPSLAGTSIRKDYGWLTALHVAAQHGLDSVAEALLELGAESYLVTPGGYPPVFYAMKGGHTALVERLQADQAARAEPLPPTFGLGIDIVVAARLGLEEMVRRHIEHDPLAVYRRGCIGESTLHWPAHNGSVGICEILLDAGLPIETDEIAYYGGKPLHWAAEHAPDCVRLLLVRGANPNARNLMRNDFEGFTPLHMMARQPEQAIECARLLINAGADPNLLDAQDRKPIDIARALNRSETIAYLESL